MRALMLIVCLAASINGAAMAMEPRAFDLAATWEWRFGGAQPAAPPALRLGLYPGTLAVRGISGDVPRPALLSLDLGGGEQPVFRLAGLAVQEKQEETSEGSRWLYYVGGGLLVAYGLVYWFGKEFGKALAECLEENGPACFDDGNSSDEDDEDEDDDDGLLCSVGICTGN